MFHIYYHLYLGPSWRTVWGLHAPMLEQLRERGVPHRLIVCVCGGSIDEFTGMTTATVEVRDVGADTQRVNEFATLAQMHADARDPHQRFDHCVYLHSKGSSAPCLGEAGAEWSAFLSKALLGALPHFEHVVARGFNSLGSNLAFGIFEDFGPARLHYSGNFWCATRALVASAPEVPLGSRYAAIRHNAEWWLARAPSFAPFNVFATGIDHYTAEPGAVDWVRLSARSREFVAGHAGAVEAARPRAFLRTMIERSTGLCAWRRRLSDGLLALLPHHRWPRLLHVHDVLMRALGSRKSTYFYCPEC